MQAQRGIMPAILAVILVFQCLFSGLSSAIFVDEVQSCGNLWHIIPQLVFAVGGFCGVVGAYQHRYSGWRLLMLLYGYHTAAWLFLVPKLVMLSALHQAYLIQHGWGTASLSPGPALIAASFFLAWNVLCGLDLYGIREQFDR